ncbi:MAG TPA: nucleoside deaminase [Flavisolibacter sp.]|nr:nucleoside deaminase [Flavisolibacter sp.]
MTTVALTRRALAIAKESVEKGNLPFGCLLADSSGVILEEAGNTVITDKNAIAHCEMNLVQQMAGKYEAGFLQSCTVYASTEPCPMCAGAIYWSGVGRIVYALDKETYHAISDTGDPAHVFGMSCKSLLETGGRVVEVVGPVLKEEAIDFYRAIQSQSTQVDS